MFCEECSCSNKAALIWPLRGNMPTRAALHLEKWTVWNDIGTPWGRRRTVRGSEQVIRSALLHVKWDTVTSSPPRFLLSPEEKLYKRSQQRPAGLVFEWSSSVSSSLAINIPVHIFSSFFLQSQTVHLCLRFSIKAFVSILFSSHLSPFPPLLSHLFSLWFMIRAEKIKRYIANWLPLFIPISASRLYRSALSLCTAEYACVGVDKVLLWRPFATPDATRRDLYMTF